MVHGFLRLSFRKEIILKVRNFIVAEVLIARNSKYLLFFLDDVNGPFSAKFPDIRTQCWDIDLLEIYVEAVGQKLQNRREIVQGRPDSDENIDDLVTG